jgi:hypothetical protein
LSFGLKIANTNYYNSIGFLLNIKHNSYLGFSHQIKEKTFKPCLIIVMENNAKHLRYFSFNGVVTHTITQFKLVQKKNLNSSRENNARQ